MLAYKIPKTTSQNAATRPAVKRSSCGLVMTPVNIPMAVSSLQRTRKSTSARPLPSLHLGSSRIPGRQQQQLTICAAGVSSPGEVRYTKNFPTLAEAFLPSQRPGIRDSTASLLPYSTATIPVIPSTVISHVPCYFSQELEKSSDAFSRLVIPTTAMAGKGLGSSGRGATMERSKLSLKQEAKETSAKLDDGHGGGNMGKGIFNGGGGDGDDGDDDDDYFNEGDGGDDGPDDSWFRKLLPELYDPRSIAAVLEEWGRTMADFPLVLRMAAQMGLFSSTALVRFLSTDARPNLTRAIARTSPTVQKEIFGRLMADPAFPQKIFLEQAITMFASLSYEATVRGDRFVKELDLVMANTLTLMAANAAVVWMVSPSRAAPAPGKMAWQVALNNLPNNVFQGETPMRSYTSSARVASFLWKSAELSGIGMIAGATQAALSNALVALHKRKDPTYEPSLQVPSIGRSAVGMAAALGTFGNMRYQMIAGIDKYLFDYANYLWSYLTITGCFRTVSTLVGDDTRLLLLGQPTRQNMSLAAIRKQQYERQQAAVAAVAAKKMKRRKRRSSKKNVSEGFAMSIGEEASAPAADGQVPALV
jgi:hypothetical protein